MDVRKNDKGHTEYFIRGKHLKLTELREELPRKGQDKCIMKGSDESFYKVPLYPRPEFRLSHLSHDTNALFEIKDKGFRAPSWEDAGQRNPKDPHRKDLLWWSLSVQPVDMKSAETRLLDRTYPDRTEEQVSGQKDFLKKFATSPSFLDTSRYGSFRLTFPLEELMGEYRKQVCNGSEPVLRVYETIMYKQEVLYSVLVHSDNYNNVFEGEYHLLDDSPDAVCAYKDGQIIWRPEAMCETHRFELVHETEEKQLKALPCRVEFYVWDHVAVAFHLPESQKLVIDTNLMRCNLKFCEPGYPTFSPPYQFHRFDRAKELVEEHWPDHGPFSKELPN